MTRDMIETAKREGIPFSIQMADGREYVVPTRDHVMVGKAHVVILGKDDLPDVLPLLTVTGLSYLAPPNGAA